MLDVVGRSHRGRVCEYRRGDLMLRTPSVIGSGNGGSEGIRICIEDGKRYLRIGDTDVPLDSDLFTTASSGIVSNMVSSGGVCVARLPFPEDIAIPDDAEIVIVPNAFELRKDARKLVDSVMRIRKAAGYNRLVCMLGIAEPSTAALLSYMGVDMFDDSLVKAAGLKRISLIPEGEISVGNDAAADNVSELERECEKIRTFIMAERLRELVDQRVSSSPSSVAALRIFDREGYEYQEEACSSVGCRFACNTTQALRRPDILQYRQKIMERYRKPDHKRILLLLPCSAKKPYHTSKTHKAFASAIHTASHDTLVHEVIITSPLGIVPRELDAMYPANSYDIPVTGEWKCEEKKIIREMTASLIAQGYDGIVCHLGEDSELVEDLAEMEKTVVGDPTSPASLKNLDETLRRMTKSLEPADYCVDRREAMRSVLVHQFGRDAADSIMDANTYAIGKFPYWKIIRENPENRKEKTQLGMLTPERGMVSLTLEGAEVLASMDMFTVEMTDFEMKGNLFAVGVVSADNRIRIGDEAVITLNGKVKGIGVAMMSGREMEDLKRGIAVKIRHKSK